MTGLNHLSVSSVSGLIFMHSLVIHSHHQLSHAACDLNNAAGLSRIHKHGFKCLIMLELGN